MRGPLLISGVTMNVSTREALLDLYDAPDPERPGRTIPGYDRDHAERTTRIVMKMAQTMGLAPSWHEDLEATALLHDLGRAGMDPELFGAIFGPAQEKGLPVRIAELRARYPNVTETQAPGFYLDLIRPLLAEKGLEVNDRLIDHVAMRMDFKGRLRRILTERAAALHSVGISVKPWMEQVMLCYYYPGGMEGADDDVRLMGMLLVACENFEAYNNRRRGSDYYGRKGDQLRAVFTTLDGFEKRGLVSREVLAGLLDLTASGELDGVVNEARGLTPDEPLPEDDRAFLRESARA
jgi:hypothetical protein